MSVSSGSDEKRSRSSETDGPRESDEKSSRSSETDGSRRESDEKSSRLSDTDGSRRESDEKSSRSSETDGSRKSDEKSSRSSETDGSRRESDEKSSRSSETGGSMESDEKSSRSSETDRPMKSDEEGASASDSSKMSGSKKDRGHEGQILYAEQHADFITSITSKWESTWIDIEKRTGTFISEYISKWKGLLIFYIKERRIPIYVGATYRIFSERLKDRDIQDMISDYLRKYDRDMSILIFNLSYIQASLEKEVLLDMFNFVENEYRSAHKRSELYLEIEYPKQETREMVEVKWEYIKSDIDKVINIFEAVLKEE